MNNMKRIVSGLLTLICVFILWALSPRENNAVFSAKFNLHLNQQKLEELAFTMNIQDTDQVFFNVFSELDKVVMVYPTENYYYFSFHANGKEFWGNIRLGRELRDLGYVGFAYWEFDNFPQNPDDSNYYSGIKRMGLENGVVVQKISPFEYQVEYKGKSVNFLLNQLEQVMPDSVKLRKGEKFLMRTFDESGLRFFLLFNKRSEDFLWILDEDNVLESFIELEGGFLFGKRTQFVFFDDTLNHRKILVGVYAENIKRNNYYDGPFDQLADNFIDENTGLREGINRAYPYARGRTNDYGEFLDWNGNITDTRMAITPYYSYYDMMDLINFIEYSLENKGDKFYSYLVYDEKKDVPK